MVNTVSQDPTSLPINGINPTPALPYRYSIFGVSVWSDLELPIPTTGDAPVAGPDWVFRRGTSTKPTLEPVGQAAAVLRCEHGSIMCALFRGVDGAWMWNRSFGMCHIFPGSREVEVYLDPGVEDQEMGFVLVSRVAIFLLQEMGYPALHTSAVVTDRGAIAFLGPHGLGKSTMAAVFLRRGASLLADDILPLRLANGIVYGGPSVPLMKLWSDTARSSLEIGHDLPNLSRAIEKKLLAFDGQYPFLKEPVPLKALYVLDRYAPGESGALDISIDALSGQAILGTLIEHTSDGRLLQPTTLATLLPLYARLGRQVAMKRIRFPSGYEYQDAVCEAIIADLDRQ